jgi:hypothetical protein
VERRRELELARAVPRERLERELRLELLLLREPLLRPEDLRERLGEPRSSCCPSSRMLSRLLSSGMVSPFWLSQ